MMVQDMGGGDGVVVQDIGWWGWCGGAGHRVVGVKWGCRT